MTNQEIKDTGLLIKNEQRIGGNTALRVGGVIEGIGYALDNKDAANGYYEASMSGGSIIVTAPNYLLGTGGNLRLKMPAAGTTASTLTIGNANQVPLLYNGAAVSSRNGWDAGEIIDVFYDGQNFLASNSEGGGDIKVENNSTGADLDINDDSNNTLVRFSEGHVKTKNFDSRDLKAFVRDADSTDLDFTDEGDNTIMRVANGHIRTKMFNSSTALTQSDLDTLYDTLRKLNHPLHGKKVGFLGDSITYGYGLPESVRLTARYSSVLCNLIECTEVNMGVSGTCIASNTINNRNNTRFVTRVTQENIGDLDFLFVFGGTNDFTYDTKPIGEHFSINTITPQSNLIGTQQLGAVVDTDTFSGALHDLISTIREVKPTLKMCFITPLNRGHHMSQTEYTHDGVVYRGARPSTKDSNTQGNYLYEFTDAIEDITSFYAIPSIELGKLLNIDPTNDDSEIFSDNIHPNAEGHEIIAKILFNWSFNNIIL